MSLRNDSGCFCHNDSPAVRLSRRREQTRTKTSNSAKFTGVDLHEALKSSDDDERRMKRREKNRVAAQKSRRRQTQRADELHEAYECLEHQNILLKKEVELLLEEQKRLTDALRAHEPLCPVLNHTVLLTTKSTEVLLP